MAISTDNYTVLILHVSKTNRILEEAKPFIRVIHDEEMWLYKNPRSEDTIPTSAMFVSTIMVIYCNSP
jgi:hypothetical protein